MVQDSMMTPLVRDGMVFMFIANLLTGVFATYTIRHHGPDLVVGSTVPVYIDPLGHYQPVTIHTRTAKLFLFFLFDTLWTAFFSGAGAFAFTKYQKSANMYRSVNPTLLIFTGVSCMLTWGIVCVYAGIIDTVALSATLFCIATVFMFIYVYMAMKNVSMTVYYKAVPVCLSGISCIFSGVLVLSRASEVIEANKAVSEWMIPLIIFSWVMTAVYVAVIAFCVYKPDSLTSGGAQFIWLLIAVIFQSVPRIALSSHA